MLKADSSFPIPVKDITFKGNSKNTCKKLKNNRTCRPKV